MYEQIQSMFKNYLTIFFLIFLCNCSHPGAALIGPAITGATTQSLGQASLSFGKNLVIKQVHAASIKTKKEVNKIASKIENLNSEIKSKDFFVSVKNLYLLDQKPRKDFFLFHR